MAGRPGAHGVAAPGLQIRRATRLPSKAHRIRCIACLVQVDRARVRDIYNPTSATQRAQSMLFYMQGSNGTASFTSYLYVNNKPVAQAQGSQSIALKKLTLQGAEPVYESTVHPGEDGYTENKLIAHTLTLAAEDLVIGADGQLDRAATALRIAQLHYSGFDQLSADGQAKLLAYIQGQLQGGTSPQPVAVGSKVLLSAYILLTESSLGSVTQITDYSLRQVGALGGLPGSTAQTHVVRAGDTLQSIAQMYLGSSSYWYLIADANGLTGSERLTEGTTLTIPNRIANSANTYDTFKVYNETEIIGTTSPEIRTIQKKKSWFQKLVQIVIIVIMIVAAVITAGAAIAVMTGVAPAALGALGALGASLATSLGVAGLGAASLAGGVLAAAAIGAGVYAAASVLTQGLAVAADLQDSFSWKAVGKAAVSGAISGVASFAGAGINSAFPVAGEGVSWQAVGSRVALEAGKQLAVDGKVSNYAGLLGAAISGGALKGLEGSDMLGSAAGWATSHPGTFSAGLSLIEGAVRGRGDNSMQWVNLATTALFEGGAFGGTSTDQANRPGTPAYFSSGADGRSLNWGAIAVQAIGTAIVANRRGEDAAISYLGNIAGEFAVQGAGRAWDQRSIPAAVSADERQIIMGYFADGPGTGPSFADDMAMRRAANNPMGLPTSSAAARVVDEGGPGRGITQIVADLSQSRSYTAQSGDNISRILGTGDPQAIGNFMRANGLRSSTIYAGQEYVIPGAMNGLGDNSALGQNALNVDNSRQQAIADARVAQAAAQSAQQATVSSSGGYADYRDPRDFQASFGYRSMIARQLSDSAASSTPISYTGSIEPAQSGWANVASAVKAYWNRDDVTLGQAIGAAWNGGGNDLFAGIGHSAGAGAAAIGAAFTSPSILGTVGLGVLSAQQTDAAVADYRRFFGSGDERGAQSLLVQGLTPLIGYNGATYVSTGIDLAAGAGLAGTAINGLRLESRVFIDPLSTRYSQATIGYRSGYSGYTIDETLDHARAGGQLPRIDVVRNMDGEILGSMDNRRIFVGRQVASEYEGYGLRATAREFDEPLSPSDVRKFTLDSKVKSTLSKRGFTNFDPVPQTWGDAYSLRILSQELRSGGRGFSTINPNGTFTDPRITGRN